MDVSFYDYDLPQELIAQTPIQHRDHSRLMVMDRETGTTQHDRFEALPSYLRAGDVLVLNDSRVRPARLIGIKEQTGAKVELLILKPLGGDRWEALVKPAKRIKQGTMIRFGEGQLMAEAETESEVAGGWIFRLNYQSEDIEEIFSKLGKMPLPPYIHQQLDQTERYQTVYSREIGSAAAPTAGLHFTDQLLSQIAEQGVKIAFLTLHVGLGTFRPVTAKRIQDHQMHAEYYVLGRESAQVIRKAKKNGGRVIAVGTTSVRTLESIANRNQETIQADQGWTDLFITPGYSFQVVDGLITNFHLPKSTLLMLVCAFSSREHVLAAYREAVRHRYRFFSFGDAMLIVS